MPMPASISRRKRKPPRASKATSPWRNEDVPLVISGAFSYGRRVKEALVLIMLVLLIVPLLVGVRRIRRLPRPDPENDRDA
jgi:hypothetical protein